MPRQRSCWGADQLPVAQLDNATHLPGEIERVRRDDEGDVFFLIQLNQ
jgi:hypothetical protein